MDRRKYENTIKYLEGRIPEEWDGNILQMLQKETKGYEVKHGTLYKRAKDGRIMRVLKEDEIDTIIFIMHNHEIGGHFGKDTTYEKIKTRYYWKGMYKDIEEYIKTCDACQRRGQKGGKGYLNSIKVGKPFERIGIDFVGPLVRTKKGNKYILVVTDYLTKWPEAKALREATAENVVEFIYKDIICRHGCPKTILSDRGTHFRNRIVDELCEKFRIKHKLSSPYHPQTNGLVERFNRTLCETLAKISEKENQWDEHIEPALFAYRTIKQGTTKRTPFFMTYGREAILPTDKLEDGDTNKENDMIQRAYEIIKLTDERNEALENIEKSQEKQKERYNEGIKEETKLRIGDKVLLKDAAKEKQWSGKLSSKWKGPYYIHDVIGNGAYKLRTMDERILKAPYNIKLLKRYYDQKDKQPIIYV
jgi:hypothetical protein